MKKTIVIAALIIAAIFLSGCVRTGRCRSNSGRCLRGTLQGDHGNDDKNKRKGYYVNNCNA